MASKKAPKKLTRAQQTQRNVEGLIVEALSALEDTGDDRMQYDGGWDDVVESWNAEFEQGDPDFITQAHLTERRVKAALMSKAVQWQLRSIARGAVYNVRQALRNQPKGARRPRGNT